tara:strand:- start:818 stop:1621 length:804 start_codon:yes stop_codon:yes gene_type:complete
MKKITEPCFLKIDSGLLTHRQISVGLNRIINELNLQGSCDFFINVVENKDNKKLGVSYLWVENPVLYNILLGRNKDGSERVEKIDDPDWVEPERDYFEAMAEAEASGEWGLMGMVEDEYKPRKIDRKLPPLYTIFKLKYSKEQKDTSEEDEKEMEFFPMSIDIENPKFNSIYSTCIPNWVSEDMLYDFFKKFCKIKKHKNKKYPIVEIKEDKNKKWSKEETSIAKITFSNEEKYIAGFIIKLAKKVMLKDKKDRSHFFFFTQSSNRR